MNEVKKHNSTDKRAAYSSFKSLAFGENIRKSWSKKSLSKIVSLDERSIAQGINRRMEIYFKRRRGKLVGYETESKSRCNWRRCLRASL